MQIAPDSNGNSQGWAQVLGPMTLLPLARRLVSDDSRTTLAQQARFMFAGLREHRAVSQMLGAPPGSALNRIMVERPQILGALVWPYQCATWSAGARMHRIIGHYSVIDSLAIPLLFSVEERLVLVRLDHVRPGMALVLDQPKWFLREGGLTMSLFLGPFRAFSISFSLYRTAAGHLVTTIGAVQGRHCEEALSIYRDLTHTLHGLRPRDFLIEMLRIVCRFLKVDELVAVSDAARCHRHPYFKGTFMDSQNYDAIWEDRGGRTQGPDFYTLPLAPARRDLATVKPGKRSMYRRRFDLLDGLDADVCRHLPHLHPVRFADC